MYIYSKRENDVFKKFMKECEHRKTCKFLGFFFTIFRRFR